METYYYVIQKNLKTGEKNYYFSAVMLLNLKTIKQLIGN